MSDEKPREKFDDKLGEMSDEMSDEISRNSDDLKLVKSFNSEVQAEMAKELLAREGIPAIILSDDCGGMQPQLQSLSKGVRLLVEPGDLEQAKDILQVIDSSD